MTAIETANAAITVRARLSLSRLAVAQRIATSEAIVPLTQATPSVRRRAGAGVMPANIAPAQAAANAAMPSRIARLTESEPFTINADATTNPNIVTPETSRHGDGRSRIACTGEL